MSGTAQELQNDIEQMENRLASVKVVVEVEREAWRRSSRIGKRGTKWKGAAPLRYKENESKTSTPTSANNPSSDDTDADVTLMPGYWDALELAQYLQDKQLGTYAQIVISKQITGKKILETPVSKLRKLLKDIETSGNDSSWKVFLSEYAKLKKHQRQLEKTVATNRSQPDSARSLDSNDRRSLKVMSSAEAPLVFPLISPRLPGISASSQAQPQNTAKPPTASKPTYSLWKPASSNNIPLATCWNCKTRFFRPHLKRSVAGVSSTDTSQSMSSSMRASLVARAYCSQACQQSIESSDIRISPSLSVKVTFNPSNATTEENTKSSRPSRGQSFISSSAGEPPGPDLRSRSDNIKGNRLGSSTKGSTSSSPKFKHSHKFHTVFARRSSRPDASVDDPSNFDFLHVAAPRGEPAALASTSSRQYYTEGHPVTYKSREDSRPIDENASGTFSMCPSVTSLASNQYRAAMTQSDSRIRSPNGKPVPPDLMLSTSVSQGAPKQCKMYHQSRYKLDPDLFQTHQETFSSCFGAIPLNNRPYTLVTGNARVDYGRGNLLRLQQFLTVRALHRLGLTSRAWFDLITMPSAFNDALWGVHVLRIWRPREEDEAFLHEIGVLKKPERPRRMLQILTRQVSRVIVDNMKILLNPESWQLATILSRKEGESIRSLHEVMGKKRDRLETKDGGELSPRRLQPAELYEQITAVYTLAGEIVALCARRLIRPVDPMAMLTDILQGLKSGELCRVYCRRLRLFSQSNRLPFNQWQLLSHCDRAVEFFWSDEEAEDAVLPPLELPVWHQKILSKLQHALQQRLLGKDSVNYVIKVAHDQNASAAVLLSFEKFLARRHNHAGAVATTRSNSGRV